MKRVFFSFLYACALLCFAGPLLADQMSQEECDKKEAGWYVTGLPLINFTTDTGVGYGVRIFLFNNGDKGADYFCSTPYLTQVYAQFFQTTLGQSYHELHWDQYRLFGTNLRLQSSMVYENNISAYYYGIGARTTEQPGLTYRYAANHTVFHSASSWENVFKRYAINPAVGFPLGYHGFGKYNNFILTRPRFYSNLNGQLMENVFFNVGISASWTGIETWNLHRFETNGHRWYSTDTQLRDEHPRGIEGGWVNIVRFGIAYRTIDFEPDPTRGAHVDYNFETSQRFLGSDYVYYRHTFGARYYLTPLEPLTLACRLAYTSSARNVPFYEMSWFNFPLQLQSGLGGNRTLRGYPTNRFVAKTMTLCNLEARFRVYEISGFGQRFVFKLVGYFDAGNAYDMAGDPFAHPRWNDYKYSYGGGLVIAWNQATIIHFLYSQGRESSQISIDFDHSIQ
jgi:hypothetical protein